MNKAEAKRIFIVIIFIGTIFSTIAMLIKYPTNLDAVNESTLSIYTQYGEFRRTSTEEYYPVIAIARSKKQINKETEVLFLDIGTFVKEKKK
ncbi:hypothetical protein [Paenibacillus qinlingensis]|uniref:Uncharacterized protein n=1 Tax=Paenibacillus qinlingensis TaxID=1837343 RepID=A0ABU1NWE6_9BACL|nr:hypothetical protein [Paenibacillus qinlingensis]MDR6551805.1 hypothetical protein [Paenibacillus qinlingensis]